jgi:hypothetical protein
MSTRFRLAIVPLGLLAAALLPACSFEPRGADYYGPKPEEMRQALQTLLLEHPDLSVPEFQMSLDYDQPVVRDGIVHLGVWQCDPRLLSFEGLFSGPNITLLEVSGRFDMNARGIWEAIPRRVLLVHKEDVGEFWRAHEIQPR